MDSAGNFYQGIFNQSNLSVDTGDFIIAGLTDNKVVGAASNHLTTDNVSTDWLTEGPSNQYFTTTRARAAFSSISPVNIVAGEISLGYSGSIRLNGSSLDTIQPIETTSSPQFARLINSSLGTFSVLLGTNTGTSFTGDRCVLIGDSVMQAASAAQQTTAIGNSAAAFATGNFNTACGANAGFGLSTGTVNTVIGCNAGRGATPLTTGSYNVLLGAGANTSSGSANNEIVIGYGVGAGSNTAKIYASAGLTVSNLIAGVLKSSAAGLITSNATTDDLTEGATNLYFTTARARGAFSAGTGVSIASGVIAIGQAVGTTSSVQFAGLTLTGLTGILKATAGTIATNATTDDLTEGKTNLYFTDARARGSFSAGTNITLAAGVIATTSNPTFSIGATIGTLNITSMNSNISNGLSLGSSAGITGGYNVYLGHQAGTGATGNYNTAIGYQALAGATGSNSFGLGFAAGYNMQTSGNVCIGSSTGQNLLTGSGYNIYIGSGAPSSSSASYEIVIGGSPAGVVGKGNSTCFISAGSGLYVSNLTNGLLKSTAGKIEQAGSGDYVQSITGTANQIIVSGTSAVTLSTPQDIATSSSPQFARLINSSIGTRNLLLGTTAGAAITTSVDTVAIGNAALSTLSTAINCTAVGSLALSTCNANNNTAVGFKASNILTTGFQNTTVGAFAGGLLTTGKYNNLFGMSAGYNISSGDTNYCLGLNAGYSITTSSDNLAIGAYTMAKNLNPITTTNGRNVAIGHYASHSLEGTPSNNIAIGYNALYAATNVTNNTIIGSSSATSTTTAINNTVVGASCMNSNITGSNNTIIGYNSGQGLNGGVNNIHIGVGCQASALNASSEIIIAGTSGTIIGKGSGTCYISSPYGLYYYSPSYWWGYAQTQTGGYLGWNKFSSRNMELQFGNNTQLLVPFAGLWEFTLSGSVYANSTVAQNMNMYVNGSVYLLQPVYYNGLVGWRSVSLSAFVVVTNTTTYISYAMAGNLETNTGAPMILTAKFISL